MSLSLVIPVSTGAKTVLLSLRTKTSLTGFLSLAEDGFGFGDVAGAGVGLDPVLICSGSRSTSDWSGIAMTFSRRSVLIVAVADMPGRRRSRTSSVMFTRRMTTLKSFASCEPVVAVWAMVWPDLVLAV